MEVLEEGFDFGGALVVSDPGLVHLLGYLDDVVVDELVGGGEVEPVGVFGELVGEVGEELAGDAGEPGAAVVDDGGVGIDVFDELTERFYQRIGGLVGH